MSQRLTLNLGLRYEMRSPMYDKDGTLLSFDFAKHALVTGTDVDYVREARRDHARDSDRAAELRRQPDQLQGCRRSAKAGQPELEAVRPAAGLRLPRAGRKEGVRRARRLPDLVLSAEAAGLGRLAVELGAGRGDASRNSVTNTALSPDGLPNYGLRSVPQYIAGVNTPDSIININDTRLLARGFNVGLLDPHHTDGRVQDWNLTFEKEIMANTVVRIGYIGNYGDQQQQEIHYNDATPAYIWYATTKAAAADRRVCQCRHAAVRPAGLRKHHAVRAHRLRPFQRCAVRTGAAFPPGLRLSRFSGTSGTRILLNRDTDDTQSIDAMPSINTFLPGAVPADFDARNRFLNYKRDPNTPKHQIRWNFVAELPDRARKEAARQLQRHRREAGRRLAGCRHREHACRDIGACRPTIIPTGNPIEYLRLQVPDPGLPSGTCFPATCVGTATFRRTGSTASMPTESRTASWACRRITSRRPRR